MPPDGYVPNAETATRIAVAVWSPIHGAKKIQAEKPFKAHLENGIWTVEGSLPEGWAGGVALLKSQKGTDVSCASVMENSVPYRKEAIRFEKR